MPASTSTTERHDQPARLHPCAGPGRSPATIARPAATRQRSTRPSRPGVQRGGFLAVATSTITHRMRDKVYVTNSWQSSRTCPVCIIVTLCMGQNLFFFSIVQTSDIALRILLSSVPLGLPLWALLSAFSRLVLHTRSFHHPFMQQTPCCNTYSTWWKVYPGFPRGLPWVPVFSPVFDGFPCIKRSPLGSRVFIGFPQVPF